MNDAGTLTVSVRIDAPPAEVFPYLVDPALMVQWIGERADLHPESGGVFAVDINRLPVRGQFVLVEPPHRVVFTWGVDGSDALPAGSTTVEIVLTADGQHTLVELIHRGLPPDALPRHRDGWTGYLGRLGAHLSQP